MCEVRTGKLTTNVTVMAIYTDLLHKIEDLEKRLRKAEHAIALMRKKEGQ